MGTFLLGIVHRSSWQTQRQLLKNTFLAVSPRTILGVALEFCRSSCPGNFQASGKMGYALLWVMLVILTASVAG